jgi:hypothetical protein
MPGARRRCALTPGYMPSPLPGAQSHRTAQGSKLDLARRHHLHSQESCNPTVLLRGHSKGNFKSGDSNLNLQKVAIPPYCSARFQVNEEVTTSSITVAPVAIPPYCSGRFQGQQFCISGSYFTAVAVAIPPYCSGRFQGPAALRPPQLRPAESQSHRTAQGDSKETIFEDSREMISKSQSHRTAQGDSKRPLSNSLIPADLTLGRVRPPKTRPCAARLTVIPCLPVSPQLDDSTRLLVPSPTSSQNGTLPLA